MSRGLLGRKVGMTQVFDSRGTVVPVTVVAAGPCVVLRLRTMERDGYNAAQLGFEDKPRRLSSRAERGTVAVLDAARPGKVEKPNCEPKRFIREFRDAPEYTVGQVLTVSELAECSKVDVIGVSKGRGFAGVMKRHHFSGVCASHGVKKVHRSGGSTGQSTDPGKVFKGTKMPGRMGGVRVTVRGLRLWQADADAGMLLLKGAIPGYSGGYVIVRETNCY
ncbi:MAG TPA: 50S ribosomal protein L3 [Schlesneria sp.]|jgi:large subunit ribosomal protein L3